MVNRKAWVAVLVMVACMLGSAPSYALDGKVQGLNRRLVGLLYQIEHHFGRPVTVTSGCRSWSHNRRIGGARESFHLRCMAADVKVSGVGKGAVANFASRLAGRGGVGTYCHDSSVHVDVGPRRNWTWTCSGRRVYSGLPAHWHGANPHMARHHFAHHHFGRHHRTRHHWGRHHRAHHHVAHHRGAHRHKMHRRLMRK